MNFEDYANASTETDFKKVLSGYRGQAHLDLMRSGEYDDQIVGEIDQELAQIAADNGVEIKNTNDFYDAPAQGDDVDYVNRHSLDTGDRAAGQAALTLKALRDPSIQASYADRPDEYEGKLDIAQREYDAAVPQATRDAARRAALDRGDIPFATFKSTDDKGQEIERLELSPTLEGLDDTALADVFEKNPQLDRRHLGNVRRLLAKPEGYTSSIAAIGRQQDFTNGFDQMLKDKTLGDSENFVKSLSDAIADGAVGNLGPSLEALDSRLRGTSFEQQFSKEERLTFLKDYATREASSKVNLTDENLDENIRILSTGEVVLPSGVYLSKPLFDRTMAESKVVPEAQKEALAKMREQVVTKRAPQAFKTILARRPEFADEYATQKAAGKNDMEILDEWTSNPENQSTAYEWASGLAESVPAAVLTVAAALPATYLDHEFSKDVIRYYAKTNQERQEFANLIGKDLGMGYDIATTIAPLVADIYVTKGVATAARATLGAVARSAVKPVVQSFFGSALRAETQGLVSSFAKGSAAKSIARSAADAGVTLEAGAAKGLVQGLKPTQVMKAVADDVYRHIGNTEVNAGLFVSGFTRSAGSAYVQIYDALEKQTNPDGSRKFTDEQLRDTAMKHATIQGATTAMTTIGFQMLGAGGVERIFSGGLTRKQTQNVFERLQKDFGKMAPSVVKDVDMASAETMLASLMKKSIAPWWKAGATGALQEMPEEAIQTFLGDMDTAWATGEKFDIDKSLKSAMYAGMIGGVMGGAVNVARETFASETSPEATEAAVRRSTLLETARKLDANPNLKATADAVRKLAFDGIPEPAPAEPPIAEATQEDLPEGVPAAGDGSAPSGQGVAGAEEVVLPPPAGFEAPPVIDPASGLVLDEQAQATIAANNPTAPVGYETSPTDPDTDAPIRVYRGRGSVDSTPRDAGWLGQGSYTTSDPDLARSYANLSAGEPIVEEAEVDPGRIYEATRAEKQRIQDIENAEGHEAALAASKAWTEALIADGYDSAKLTFPDGSFELVVFDKARLRQTNNPDTTSDTTSPETPANPATAGEISDMSSDTTPAAATPQQVAEYRTARRQAIVAEWGSRNTRSGLKPGTPAEVREELETITNEDNETATNTADASGPPSAEDGTDAGELGGVGQETRGEKDLTAIKSDLEMSGVAYDGDTRYSVQQASGGTFNAERIVGGVRENIVTGLPDIESAQTAILDSLSGKGSDQAPQTPAPKRDQARRKSAPKSGPAPQQISEGKATIFGYDMDVLIAAQRDGRLNKKLPPVDHAKVAEKILADAKKFQIPVAKSVVDSYGLTLPGYVLDGDLYVFQPEQSSAQTTPQGPVASNNAPTASEDALRLARNLIVGSFKPDMQGVKAEFREEQQYILDSFNANATESEKELVGMSQQNNWEIIGEVLNRVTAPTAAPAGTQAAPTPNSGEARSNLGAAPKVGDTVTFTAPGVSSPTQGKWALGKDGVTLVPQVMRSGKPTNYPNAKIVTQDATKPAWISEDVAAALRAKGFDPADAPMERLPKAEMSKYPITQAILDAESAGKTAITNMAAVLAAAELTPPEADEQIVIDLIADVEPELREAVVRETPRAEAAVNKQLAKQMPELTDVEALPLHVKLTLLESSLSERVGTFVAAESPSNSLAETPVSPEADVGMRNPGGDTPLAPLVTSTAEGEAGKPDADRYARIKAMRPIERTLGDVEWANTYSKARALAESESRPNAPQARSVEFLESMTPMQRGKARSALGQSMLREGKPQTRQQIVESMVDAGAVIVAHPTDGRRLQKPDGAYIEERRLTKTAMDYAAHLTAPIDPTQQSLDAVRQQLPASAPDDMGRFRGFYEGGADTGVGVNPAYSTPASVPDTRYTAKNSPKLTPALREKLNRPDRNVIAWTYTEIDRVNTALGDQSPFSQINENKSNTSEGVNRQDGEVLLDRSASAIQGRQDGADGRGGRGRADTEAGGEVQGGMSPSMGQGKPAIPLSNTRTTGGQRPTGNNGALPGADGISETPAGSRSAVERELESFGGVADIATGGQAAPDTAASRQLKALGFDQGLPTLLTNVAKTGTPEQRAFASFLLKVFPDVMAGLDIKTVHLTGKDLTQDYKSIGLSGQGLTDQAARGIFAGIHLSNGQVLINTAMRHDIEQGGVVGTVLHELAHVATRASIDNPTPAQALVLKRLQRILDSVNKRIDTLPDAPQYLRYGTSNLHEFVAHWFTSPQFQREVAALTPKGEKNWLHVIIDTIKDLLNGRSRTETNKVGTEIMRDMLTLLESVADTSRMGQLLMQPADVRDEVRFHELATEVLGEPPTQADIDSFKSENAAAYAELKAMRERVLRGAGYNVGPVYHGTRNKKFTTFSGGDLGNHFGLSEDQVFGEEGRFSNSDPKDLRLIEAMVRLSNPARLTDHGSWSDWLTVREVNDITGSSLAEEGSTSPQIVATLKAAGFDGVSYENTHEGPDGSEAVIAFDPNQIKSTEPLSLDPATGRLIPPSQWGDAGSPSILMQPADMDLQGDESFNNEVQQYVTGNWPSDAAGRFEEIREFAKQWVESYGFTPDVNATPDEQQWVRDAVGTPTQLVAQAGGDTIQLDTLDLARFDPHGFMPPTRSVAEIRRTGEILIHNGSGLANELAKRGDSTELAAKVKWAATFHEEVVHAAQLLALKRRIGQSDDFKKAVEGEMAELMQEIADTPMSFEESNAIARNLLASDGLYRNRPYSDKDFQSATLAEVLADAEEGRKAEVLHELVRQVVQLRRIGNLSETTYMDVMKTLTDWVRNFVKVLKELARNPAARGERFNREIRETEAALDELGVSTGDTQANLTASHDAGIAALDAPTEAEREWLRELHHLTTTGNLSDRLRSRYRVDPTALERLVTYLKAAVRELMTSLKQSFNMHSSVHLDRLGRELARAQDGYHVRNGAKPFDPNDAPLMQMPAEPFYSQLQRTVEAKIPSRATPEQIMATVRAAGVKAEEIKWSGIEQALQSLAVDGKVPKDALLAYLAEEGSVRFDEGTLGGKPQRMVKDIPVTEWAKEAMPEQYAQWENATDPEDKAFLTQLIRREHQWRAEAEAPAKMAGDPKFGQYVLPGGENYREVVLAMPPEKLTEQEAGKKYYETRIRQGFGPYWSALSSREQREILDEMPREEFVKPADYTSSHFPDVPNYVAHMRTNERDGGLFIEELQSDRHQAGRKQGYRVDETRLAELMGKDILTQAESDEMGNQYGKIADAPFRTTWPLALFKRALRDAVASGKTWIGWTVGETQNDRFDLSKQVDSIEYATHPNRPKSEWRVIGYKGGEEVVNKLTAPEDLPNTVGKEVAERLVNTEPTRRDYDAEWNYTKLAGKDLQVGGSGMKGFYDNMLPKEIGKYVKQWGGKVELSEIADPDAPDTESFLTFMERTGLDLDPALEVYEQERRSVSPVGTPIWRIEITPAMKASVSQGQPLFQMPAAGPLSSDSDFNQFTETQYTEVNVGNILYESTEEDFEKKGWFTRLFGQRDDLLRAQSALRVDRKAALNTTAQKVDVQGGILARSIKKENPNMANVRAMAGSTAPILTPEEEVRLDTEYQERLEAAYAIGAKGEDTAKQDRDTALAEAKQTHDDAMLSDDPSERAEAVAAYEQAGKDIESEFRRVSEEAKAAAEIEDPDVTAAKEDADTQRENARKQRDLSQEQAKQDYDDEVQSPDSAVRVAARGKYEAHLKEITKAHEKTISKITETRDKTVASRTTEAQIAQAIDEANEWLVQETNASRLRQSGLLRDAQDAAAEALHSESPLTYAAVMSLRTAINEFQAKLAKEFKDIRPGLSLTIDQSNGIYLVRQWEFHRDPQRREKIMHDPEYADLKDRLVNFFGKEFARDQLAVLKADPAHANTPDADLEALAYTNVRDLSIAKFEDYMLGRDGAHTREDFSDGVRIEIERFMKKNNQDPLIAEMLGEIDDPLFNLTNTLTSVSHILFTHRQNVALAADGKANGYLVTEAQIKADPSKYRGWVPLMGKTEDAPAHAPLGGLYSTPEHKKAFDAAFGTNSVRPSDTASEAMKVAGQVLKGAAGKSMAIMILGNPGKYTRDIVGTTLLAGSQGLNPFSRKGFKSAMATWDMVRGQGKGDQAFIEKMISYRILGDGANIEFMREFFAQYQENPTGAMAWAASKGDAISPAAMAKLRKGKGAWDKMVDVLGRSSEFTETFLGPLVFLNELEVHLKAGFSQIDAEQEAARIAKKVLPGKSERSQFINEAGKSGAATLAAPFLGFKSEMIRSVYGTWITGFEHAFSDNPVLRAHGLRRLAASSVVQVGLVSMLPILFRAMANLDDEEEELFRAALPNYSKNSNFWFFRTADGSLRAADMTFTIPYSITHDWMLLSARAVVNRRWDDVPGIFGRLLGAELIGEQIAAGKVFDLMRNKDENTGHQIYREDEDLGAIAYKHAAHVLWGAYTPAVVKKTWDAIQATHRPDKEDEDFTFTPLGISLGMLAPTKLRAYDNSKVLARALREVTNASRQQWVITNKLTSPQAMAPGESAKLIKERTDAHFKNQARAYRFMKAAKGHMSPREIMLAADAGDMSRERAQLAMQGFGTLKPLPADTLQKIRKIDPKRYAEVIQAMQAQPKRVNLRDR